MLAVFAALIIGLGQLFGLDLQHVALLGAALGGVLGLVPHEPPLGKLGGFLVGFVAAWIGFALRAAVLPDSAGGRAVAAFLVVAVIGVACAVSAGNLPLWSGLLGAAAIVGAYEETYTNAPSQFLQESPAAGTTVLFAVALGFLAASLIPLGQAGAHSRGTWDSWFSRGSARSGDDNVDTVGIDGLVAGDNK
ncbi:hypothetical protein GCM10027517_27050 [Phycicoccus ginsengisoli]